jgi:P4 family phage/plasmid primase-like protien
MQDVLFLKKDEQKNKNSTLNNIELRSNNKADLLEEVKQNKEENLKDGKYQIVTLTNGPWMKVTNNGRGFLNLPFAEYFLKKHIIYSVEEAFYVYKSGFYKKTNLQSVKALIEAELRKLNCLDMKTSWVKETIDRIQAKRHLSYEKFNKIFNQDKTIINVKNGIIKFDLKTGDYKFLPHSSEYKSTIQLNVMYNEKSKNIESWTNFLETSLNTEKERKFLCEIMGYTLMNYLSNSGQNFYCFHGEGGNGKGTVFRLLNEILGITNVGSCKAKQLTDSENQNQFFGFQFINKLIIEVSETNYNFKDLSLVKQLSGGDFQQIEKKKENETLNFIFEGKLLISTNDKVKFYDTSEGVKRRAKFLVMNNKIKKPMSDLDERLKKEKESIFLILLKSLKGLIKNDFIHTLPESHFKIFDKYMEHSNNYLKFIRKHIVLGGSLAKAEIVTLFNDQYGSIYKDKDKLFDSFEKELENEKIYFELKKCRTKSVFSLEEKITMSYVGISYVEFKSKNEEEKDKIREINDMNVILNQLKTMKDNIISLRNSKVVDECDVEMFEKEFEKVSNEFTLLKLESLNNKSGVNQVTFDIDSEKSKVNRGETLDNIYSDNVEEKEDKISKEDKPSEEDLKCRDFIDDLTSLLEEHFGSFESSYARYTTYLTGIYFNTSKIKSFMPEYEDFVTKWKKEDDYKKSKEYKNMSDEDKKKWENENNYKNSIEYTDKCHTLLEYLDNTFGKRGHKG